MKIHFQILRRHCLSRLIVCCRHARPWSLAMMVLTTVSAIGADSVVGIDRPAGLDGKPARQTRADNSLKMSLSWCPPGQFQIGTPGATGNEQPVQITLKTGFWIGQTEVTRGQWSAVMATKPWEDVIFKENFPKDAGADYPVCNINWDQACQFCERLTHLEHVAERLPRDQIYSLPSEAEWEYACRAGSSTKYSFGDDDATLGEFAWFEDNAYNAGEPYPHRVGLKKPNPWGIFDMHGNVSEWCLDEDQSDLPHSGIVHPKNNPKAKFRMIRDGSFGSDSATCRSAFREGGAKPHTRFIGLGFRVVIVHR